MTKNIYLNDLGKASLRHCKLYPVVSQARAYAPHYVNLCTLFQRWLRSSRSCKALSNMVSPQRRVTNSFSNPTHYCFKRIVSLASAHNHNYIWTRTLSTRRMTAHIANDVVNISALIFLWLSFQERFLSFAYLGLSPNEPAARNNNYHFPTSVALPTTHATKTTLPPLFTATPWKLTLMKTKLFR